MVAPDGKRIFDAPSGVVTGLRGSLPKKFVGD